MDRLTTLDAVVERVWRRLEAASERSGHPFRTLTFGTVNGGAPRLRTVVLRAVDADERRMAFHTDRRSQKVADLRSHDRIAWRGWDPDTREQVRLRGTGHVHVDDEIANAMWQQQNPATLALYSCPPAPGSPLDGPDDGRKGLGQTDTIAREDVQGGRRHFAVVVTIIDEIDWLHLHPEGHYRARFHVEADRHEFTGTWIVP